MLKEIKDRRSIRKYNEKQVEEEKLQEILEAGRLAPSGSNTQPWHFIIVKSVETREKISKASKNQKWMNTAPIFIVCVGDIKCRIKDGIAIDENSKEFEVKQIIRDTSISIENMVLQAESLGLSTCWVSDFTQEDIRNVLEIPNDKFVVTVLTLGYKDENPKERPRRKMEDILHYKKW